MPHLLLRYAVAVASVAAALAVTLSLPELEHIPGVLFLAAVAVAAWFGRLGPGLLATFLSALLLDYFFIPEKLALDFGPATWVVLGEFVAVAILFSLLIEAQRRLNHSLRIHDERKTEFMAELGHELRNFLSPISYAVDILRLEGTTGEAVEEARATIAGQVRNMSRLVNDLLDAARINQGKIQLLREPSDLAEIIAGAVDGARPLIAARGHSLETTLPPGPLPIDADRTRLEQVFVNLLTNAAKYTEPGGRIWLTVERSSSELLVRVRDNGKGLAPDVQPYVFDLFMQAETGFQGGLGIGLCLVRRLVEMHGGRVAASSDGEGCGSEFLVRLPIGSPAESQPTASAAARPQELTTSGENSASVAAAEAAEQRI